MSVNQNFRLIQAAADTDNEGFINLGQQASEKSYRVLVNDAGQILLDPIDLNPIDNVPDREQWLRQNSTALASLQRGIVQAKAGEIQSLGSFAQYAELELDD